MTREPLMPDSRVNAFCGECGGKIIPHKQGSSEKGRRICPFCGGFIHDSCASVHNAKHKDELGSSLYSRYLKNIEKEGISEKDVCCVECGDKLLKHTASSNTRLIDNLTNEIVCTCEYCGGYLHDYCKDLHYAHHEKPCK